MANVLEAFILSLQKCQRITVLTYSKHQLDLMQGDMNTNVTLNPHIFNTSVVYT